MAVTSFIPEVWNARLLNALRADLVYTNLFNRNYEGDIRQAGDTVHINTITDISIKDYTRNTDIDNPEQLTTADQTLVVDQAKYYNFYLNDVDKAQAKPGLIDAAMASASHGLAEAVDKYLADLLSKATGVITAGLGSTTTPLQITAANAYELLVNMNRQVRVLDPKEPFEGKAMGITKKGELIVDTWESRKLVSSGEVSVRGIYGYV